ncbi:MAG: pantoate--beta-alanine ligase [Pseudomonadota bacterium]
MKILRTVEDMRRWSMTERRAGKTIAFVPTMGALHEGHLSLLRAGKERADRLVLSIYVNPTQFGPKEDLGSYPRDFDGDLGKAEGTGVDAVFFPSDEAMYPKGYETFVTVEEVTKHLCGASRPGHFRGVTTIVAKLFNIVAPDVALFGEKDFQQLVVIKKMAADLNMPIEIVGYPIVREPDGLAMSSRNQYLSREERQAALSLSRALDEAGLIVEGGETRAAQILAQVRATIEATKIVRIDYAELVDAETLTGVERIKGRALLALAAFVGKTRLIDNRLLRFSLPPK